MKPLVSVCILAQNHESFIADLISSLNDQTEKNFEIVFIDNASDDLTYEKGLELIESFSLNLNFSIKNKQSRNIPSNLNKAIRNANAEYVLIISADDWLTENSIFEKVNFLKDYHDFIAVSSSIIVYNQDTGEKKIQIDKIDNYDNQFEKLMLGEISFNSPGALYRKKILQDVGLFDENIDVEDFDMWLKLCLRGPIGVLSNSLVYYRRHTDNSSTNSILKVKWMAENVIKTMRKYKSHPVYSKAIFGLYNRIFISQFSIGNPVSLKEKIKALIRVLKLGKHGRKAVFYFLINKFSLGRKFF